MLRFAFDSVIRIKSKTLYAISLRCRKRIEDVFGWIKAQAGYERVKVRGKPKVTAAYTFGVAAYNLIRLPKLLATTQT